MRELTPREEREVREVRGGGLIGRYHIWHRRSGFNRCFPYSISGFNTHAYLLEVWYACDGGSAVALLIHTYTHTHTHIHR
jgi:hypothetical protein